MAAVDQQHVAFWDKEIVVFDVGGEVGIDMVSQSIAHKRAARAATQRHLLDLAARQSGMAQAWRADLLRLQVQKSSFIHRTF